MRAGSSRSAGFRGVATSAYGACHHGLSSSSAAALRGCAPASLPRLMVTPGSSSRASVHFHQRSSYHATTSTGMDMREALNQAFSFRPTPESMQAEALRARIAHEVPADLDFDLQPLLLKTALEQHRKDDVLGLMRDLAKANAKARNVITARIERFTKQMDAEMAQKQERATTASNATKTAAPKIEPSPAAPAKEGDTKPPADKMSMQEAVLHGQLSAKELEGVLRDLHREISLSQADEKQIKDEARALWEAGTAAVMAVDQSLPRHFTTMVIDAYPWADLLLAEDVSSLVINSPNAKMAARIRAMEVLNRQESIKENMSWISRLVLPTIAPSKVRKGQTPHVYDAALDAVVQNELDTLLTTKTGEKYIEDTFRHVVQKFEEAPENIARTIAGTLHSTFVGVFIARMREAGIDYYADTGKNFAKTLLSSMKPLNPYFAQQKRDLDAAAASADTGAPS